MALAGSVARVHPDRRLTARAAPESLVMPLIVLTLALMLVALVSGAAVFVSGLSGSGGVLDVVFLLSVGAFLACLVVLIRRRAMNTVASHIARLEAAGDEEQPPESPVRSAGRAENRPDQRVHERRDRYGSSDGMGSLRMSMQQSRDIRDPR